MKRLSVFLILQFIVALLVCSSCVREIVMDAGEKPTVVVECVINNTAPQTLHLRYTKGASKKDYEVVTEAEAVLHDLTDGTQAGRFVKAEDGVWILDYEAVDEHEYRLEVNVPGYETITAEQTMPVRPKVRARRICHGSPFIGVHSPHGEWDMACNYSIYGGVSGSLWIYAMNYNKRGEFRELAAYICSSPIADSFNSTDILYTPVIDTVLYTYQVTNNGFPASAGIYHELRGCKMHDRYLRFEKNPGIVMVSGTFEGFYPVEFVSEESEDVLNGGVITNPSDDQGYLVFASVSHEYDKYHTETLFFQELQESFKLTDIYFRENVYTNINGGLGIFGAKAETKMVWSDSPTLRIL